MTAFSHDMPQTLAYAMIEVPDIEASVAWYEYHVGLTPTGGGGDQVFLRTRLLHHCLELISAPHRKEAWTSGFGFTVADQRTLDALHEKVSAAGCSIGPLHDSTKGHCSGGFSVVDPDGFVVELLHGFHEYAVPPDQVMSPVDVVHPFLSTAHFDDSYDFYTRLLGFRPSDHIVGSTSFLRCGDRYHHSLALRRDDKSYVAHLCFLMESFDQVMRRRARALYKKVPIPSDLVNHSASGSLAFYMRDPLHGPRIELCDNHIVLDEQEHETRTGRLMSPDPRNIDIWRAAADDWERF